MSERAKKYELDLDKEDFVVRLTDRSGRKRAFRLVTSEGMIDYRDARGRRFLRLMLEEVE